MHFLFHLPMIVQKHKRECESTMPPSALLQLHVCSAYKVCQQHHDQQSCFWYLLHAYMHFAWLISFPVLYNIARWVAM